MAALKQESAYIENVNEEVARVANQDEHDETPWQAIKAHPWTLVWSIYAIWILILNSFENQAGGSILGIPQFRQVRNPHRQVLSTN
jgi:SP family general alpha glucoside:H+ symporter-like MFS transporter